MGSGPDRHGGHFSFIQYTRIQIANLGVWDTLFKKGAHMTGYALLAMSCARGMGQVDKKSIITAWLLAVVYAARTSFTNPLYLTDIPAHLMLELTVWGLFSDYFYW